MPDADAEQRPPSRDPLAQRIARPARARARRSRRDRRRRSRRAAPRATTAGSVVTAVSAPARARTRRRRCAGSPRRSRRGRRFTRSALRRPDAVAAGAHAAPSARPSALKAASATWWSSRPDAETWIVKPPSIASRSSACGSSVSGEPADALAREGERDLRVRPAHEVDGRGRTRLVHRHRRRAVARDAVPRPERLRERVPNAASTSSTVWCSSTSRSPDASSSRSKPPWNAQQRQEMVEEADAGRDARLDPAVEVEREPQRRLGASCARRWRCDRPRSPVAAPSAREQHVVLARAGAA